MTRRTQPKQIGNLVYHSRKLPSAPVAKAVREALKAARAAALLLRSYR